MSVDNRFLGCFKAMTGFDFAKTVFSFLSLTFFKRFDTFCNTLLKRNCG